MLNLHAVFVEITELFNDYNVHDVHSMFSLEGVDFKVIVEGEFGEEDMFPITSTWYQFATDVMLRHEYHVQIRGAIFREMETGSELTIIGSAMPLINNPESN